LKILDKHLNGKKYLIGENLSLADLQIGTSLSIGFQSVFDKNFREEIKNLTQWYERFINNPAIIKRFGKIKLSAKSLVPI